MGSRIVGRGSLTATLAIGRDWTGGRRGGFETAMSSTNGSRSHAMLRSGWGAVAAPPGLCVVVGRANRKRVGEGERQMLCARYDRGDERRSRLVQNAGY